MGLSSCDMKIMSWNVRRLGRLKKRSRVRQTIKERKVDVLLLQETKQSRIYEMFAKSIWPWEMMEFMVVDLEGNAEGLLSL